MTTAFAGKGSGLPPTAAEVLRGSGGGGAPNGGALNADPGDNAVILGEKKAVSGAAAGGSRVFFCSFVC